MGDENHIRTLGDYFKPSHKGYRNTIELPIGNNVVPLRSDTIRRTIDQSAGGKLHNRNAKESRALLEDLALYDNESWNDPRDFAKPVKAIALPQDVPMNKVTTLCEICSGPHDTQYCMEDPKQAFVEYASSRTYEAGGIAEDALVDVVGYVYLVDYVILDIKEDEKRPFILGTPFLTTAKAVIKFDKGTVTLRSGKSKINFHRIPESLCKGDEV
ncbi:MAK10-like protein [Tanacetum coccineum]